MNTNSLAFFSFNFASLMYLVYDLHKHLHIHLRKMHLKPDLIYVLKRRKWEGMNSDIFVFLMKIPIQLPPLNHLFSLSSLIFPLQNSVHYDIIARNI